ncbi:hypothetical protein [Hydrocarboniphaga effusa]|uniref:hypothetical protein n=1 Tax=Hydrocarboniphaga effusa TaxID=243629 RepID=UPI00398C180E
MWIAMSEEVMAIDVQTPFSNPEHGFIWPHQACTGRPWPAGAAGRCKSLLQLGFALTAIECRSASEGAIHRAGRGWPAIELGWTESPACGF